MSLEFTPETDVEFAPGTVEEVHADDLSFVVDLETGDDGEVLACEVDLPELVRVLTLYSSSEEFQYDWRSGRRKPPAPDDPVEEG